MNGFAQEYSCHTYDGYANISVRNDIFLFVSVMPFGVNKHSLSYVEKSLSLMETRE